MKYWISLLLLLGVISNAIADIPEVIVCKQKYALCTSAPCVSIPGSDGKALCFCAAHDGKSLGLTSCDARKPKADDNGNQLITSTFSLRQFIDNQQLNCPNGVPWANCLDMPCMVDSNQPNQAACTCKIVRKGNFVTLGGEGNPQSCNKSIWSGAAPAQNERYMKIMREQN